jgi:hypothetical protein
LVAVLVEVMQALVLVEVAAALLGHKGQVHTLVEMVLVVALLMVAVEVGQARGQTLFGRALPLLEAVM